MPNSKQIVYLSQAQYTELIANGNITVDGVTVTYDENDIYVTPQAEPVTDVRINGTSVAANGVADVPVAGPNTLGVIKTDADYGTEIANQRVKIVKAADDQIKQGVHSSRPIAPSSQHMSTFYGLAKAAGHDEKDSTEPLGTYTPEAKGAIQSMLGTNTMLAPDENDLTADKAYAAGEVFTANGKLYKATAAIPADGAIITDGDDANCEETSVAGAFVKKTDVATNTSLGIVKGNSTYGISVWGGETAGQLAINPASNAQIKSGNQQYAPITATTQHQATFYGLAKAAGDTTQSQSDNAVGTYTNEAKAAIQQMLDVPSNSDIPDVSVYATKADTVLDTTLSLGRLANSDVGENSVALGYDVTASGDYSFATGSETIASSDSAHAEGENTQATDSAAHAEGTYTQANGYASHAEGDNSIANGWFAHAEGSETTASGRSTHVFGERNYNNNKYPSEDNEQRGTMVEIVGNGEGTGYSNARALTWTGDEYLAGNLYVHANGTSTSGTRVATVTEIPEVPVQDVQVNGVSVLSNGVANVPIASTSNFGVAKIGSYQGVTLNANKELALETAADYHVKSGTTGKAAIVPLLQHQSTFYGLAKAAGADEKDSTLPVGQYTDTAKSAIRSMIGATSDNVIAVQDTQPTDADTKIWLPETAPEGIEVPTMNDMNAALATKVGDVQVNGTSITTNGIANIPMIGYDHLGVAKLDQYSTYGIGMREDGNLQVVGANDAQYKASNSERRPVMPTNQHKSVFYGLAKAAGDTTQAVSDNAVGTYTSEAKSAIQQMLGVPSHDTVIAWTVDSLNATGATIAMHSDSPLPITGTCYNYVVFPEDITFENTTSNPITIRTTQQWSTGEDSAQLAFVNLMFNDAIVPAGTTLTVAAGTYPMMMQGMTTWRIYTDGTVPGLGNYVKKTDYATSSLPGLVRPADGLIMSSANNGAIMVNPASSSTIKAGVNVRTPVGVSLQHEAAFYGLAKAAGDTSQSASSNAVGTYTDDAKLAIQTMLGIDLSSIAAEVEIPLVETITDTDVTINGQPNFRYNCGEVSTIAINPPAAGSIDVIFTSGTSAAILTLPATVKMPAWFDATALETETIYEILITDGTYGSVMTWPV